MKNSLLCIALGTVAAAAGAQEVGQVLSSTPVVQQVAVPRQVCTQAMVTQPQTSGGGGVVGALIGGAIGSQFGNSSHGQGVGALVGAVSGAIIGNQMEAQGNRAQAVPQCTTQMSYETRTVGYNVTYEYAGRQYTTQMPNDPGPTVQLQVTPVGAQRQQFMPQAGMQPGAVVIAPPVGAQPVAPAEVVVPSQVVVPATYAAPVYYPAPVYVRPVPIGISLDLGYSRGYRYRHWR